MGNGPQQTLVQGKIKGTMQGDPDGDRKCFVLFSAETRPGVPLPRVGYKYRTVVPGGTGVNVRSPLPTSAKGSTRFHSTDSGRSFFIVFLVIVLGHI